VNFVTPEVGMKDELLFNKLASATLVILGPLKGLYNFHIRA
jgi:hypothetical protein